MLFGIITSILLFNIKDTKDINRLTNMYADISLLTDRVTNYYTKYEQIPAFEKEGISTIIDSIRASEDNPFGVSDTGKFLVLELNALENLSLNYGQDYEKIKQADITEVGSYTNLYVINENSHNIFFLKGISVEGKNYYTNKEEDVEAVSIVDVIPHVITITNVSNKFSVQQAETINFTATVDSSEPAGTITWHCSPSGAVTFSNATGDSTTITAVTAGSVTITATINGKSSNQIVINITPPPGSITATFNANGGETPVPSTISKTAGTALGTLPTTTRTDYSFDGWFTEASGGTQITESTPMPSTATTYFAHWTETPKVTVAFNANGGTGTMASVTVDPTTTINTFSNRFTAPSGYTFDGWASSETSHTALTEAATSDRTVYAIWKCDGTGSTCNGKTAHTCSGMRQSGSAAYCNSCGKRVTNSNEDVTACNSCGGSVTWKCYNCGKALSRAAFHYCRPCWHGYSSSHTYYESPCVHGQSSSHVCCTHNNTSTHYYK